MKDMKEMTWHQPFFRWLLCSVVCQWFIAKCLPHLRFDWLGRDIPRAKIAEGFALLRRNDVILTVSTVGLSALLTRGFDHAARCLSVWPTFAVIGEMTIKGFGDVTWTTLCRHARRVVILRTRGEDALYVSNCVHRCWALQKAEYDTKFTAGDHRKSCVELVTETDAGDRLGIVPRRNWLTGLPYVTPQQLLTANMDVIWDSDGVLDR